MNSEHLWVRSGRGTKKEHSWRLEQYQIVSEIYFLNNVKYSFRNQSLLKPNINLQVWDCLYGDYSYPEITDRRCDSRHVRLNAWMRLRT